MTIQIETNFILYERTASAEFATTDARYPTMDAALQAMQTSLAEGREVVIAREERRGLDRAVIHTGVHRVPNSSPNA